MTRVTSPTDDIAARGMTPPAWLVWSLVAAGLAALWFGLGSPAGRSAVLRVVLLVLAAGELGGALTQALAGSTPGGIELLVSRQDFALYNVATSTLLVLTVIDPGRYVHVLEVAIALYAVHGAAHLLRWAGVLARRPDRGIELRQGMPLLAAALALLLFHP